MVENAEFKVSATEFSRNFAQYKDRALGGDVIKVMSHDRVVGGYLSPKDLEHYERLKRRERQALRTVDLPEEIIEEIKNARYGAKPE